MEKDKLTVRERLIDFIKWCDEKDKFPLYEFPNEIDEYLTEKSINQSSIETGTLEANEAKEKVCEHVATWKKGNGFEYKACEKCGVTLA